MQTYVPTSLFVWEEKDGDMLIRCLIKEQEGVVSTSQIKHPHSFSLLIETGFAYGNPDLTNSVWDFLLANTLGN